ncbi:N-alpha-acetyltransferase 35 isoform X2 [Arctopsyche grandis]|uniref:N-alpha-acetyltransferase 35 isoform X2 n=1 Tax=Arctopsyche grandis TaxID=121162 RepID=UPI00406D6DD2
MSGAANMEQSDDSDTKRAEHLENSKKIYNWVDITDDFMELIKELELGELMHEEFFGLFEAMSAIEMMDPKMDAGMHCNRGTTKPLTFQQAVESKKLKLEDLTSSELIGIVDATLSCIVSWLEGHSLAQTVFTNLYLHQPLAIKDKTLKAFCIAIYKILDLIRNYINSAQVYEEEDFQPMGYGYCLGSNSQNGDDLSSEITEQKCISALREQEDDLHRKSRSNAQEGDGLIGLYSRIKFTRMFYQTLTLLLKKDQGSINDCTRLLAGCSEMLIIMSKTMEKGTQLDENSDMPNPIGFEPLVNQRLLPPTFPRYTRIKPRAEALQYFNDLISKLKEAMKVTSISSFHSVLDFFIKFSRSQPCILSRSALQLLYLGGRNGSPLGANVPEALREAARTFICPPALVPRYQLLNNPQAREYVEIFLNRCARPFTILLQVCGHNRARQRDKLAHLLSEFATLKEEAENIDIFLRALTRNLDTPRPSLPCFGTWILYHIIRIMIMYLLSGLELELYSVHEYHYIFWYLYEFLYGWLNSALNNVESILAEQEAANASNSANSGGGGGGRRAPRPPRHKKRPTPRPSQHEALMCQIMQNLCGGYYKALVAFQNQGKIPNPISHFDNEAVRYKHRFAPLSVMTPPLVQYTEFKRITLRLRYENPIILYLGGCKHFQLARTLMESIPNPDQEITDLLKVAKTNFVVLKLLAGGHKSDSMTPPDFDFSVHRHFPIIKLV